MTNICYTFYIKNMKTFENIVNKKKRIEGRLNKNNKILSIKNNSYIKFIHYYNNSKYYEINARVIYINKYDNFNNMLLHENINYIIPDANIIDDALNIYNTYYSKKQQQLYNISAIYFTTIDEL